MSNGHWLRNKIEIPFWVQRIFNLRRKKGVSQAELAESMQLSRAQLRAIEAGQRPVSIPEAQSAAAKLGVELWEFFTRSNRKDPVTHSELELIVTFRSLSEKQKKLIFDLIVEFENVALEISKLNAKINGLPPKTKQS